MTRMVCLHGGFGITSSILKLRGFPFYLILGDMYLSLFDSVMYYLIVTQILLFFKGREKKKCQEKKRLK